MCKAWSSATDLDGLHTTVIAEDDPRVSALRGFANERSGNTQRASEAIFVDHRNPNNLDNDLGTWNFIEGNYYAGDPTGSLTLDDDSGGAALTAARFQRTQALSFDGTSFYGADASGSTIGGNNYGGNGLYVNTASAVTIRGQAGYENDVLRGGNSGSSTRTSSSDITANIDGGEGSLLK